MDNIYLMVDFTYNGLKIEFINVISLISIFFGIFTIISVNPIFSVLFLIGLFSSIAVFLLFIGFDFLGLAYILVYVGAVSILFLFILMLINIRKSELLSESNNYILLAILIVLLFFFIIGQVIPLTYQLLIVSLFNLKNLFTIFNEYYYYFFDKLIYTSSNSWDDSLIDILHITSIGNIMYSSYSIWLIIVSIILLLAMVGSIVITIKQTK